MEHDDGLRWDAICRNCGGAKKDRPLFRRRISFTISVICRIIVRPERWIIRSPRSCFWFCWRVLAGAETFCDIARFGERKIELLRRFRPYVNGTPSHDHLGDIFATLDARAFQRCFVAWVADLTNTPPEVIAVDGKTSRRSYQKKGSKEAIHIVSAFAARQRIVLGQVKVNEKSNEIVAIPALLGMMSIEGAVVTIDAMGCQRDIAAKIIEG